MKTLILAFLFIIATSSASYQLEQQQLQLYLQVTKQVIQKLQQVDFDPSQFFLGLNDELDLICDECVQKCAGIILPTLIGIEQVLQNMGTLQWNGAFEIIPGLRETLFHFKDYCDEPWTAYSAYFGAAASVLTNDPLQFFETVLANLVQGKYDAILDGTNFIVMLLQGLDYKAGQSFANLLQVALSSFLPPPSVNEIKFLTKCVDN